MSITAVPMGHARGDSLAPIPATGDPRAREVAAQFEGMLFAQALAPMAKTCGFLGDTIVNVVATDLARRDESGLGATLERAIESARHDAASAP